MFRRKYARKGSALGRFFKHGAKMFVSVAILSVFVLGIVYGVRKVSSTSVGDFLGLVSPYLSKVGIEQDELGQVAGDLIKRVTDFGVYSPYQSDGTSENEQPGDISSATTTENEEGALAVLALVADSHVGNDADEYVENKTYLARGLEQVAGSGVENVIHVGDITNFGDEQSLIDAREILEASNLDYLVLPGDRDLAQTSDLSNFTLVFGTDNKILDLAGYKFVIFNNSTNYTLISQEKVDWFERELEGADFVILSQPLYTEGILLFNCQYMGSSCETPEDEELRSLQAAVKGQRDKILSMVRESNVRAVIAGDHHRSSRAQDKTKPELIHYVVGALGGTFSEYAQSGLQSQRFSLMKLYSNGAFTIEDVIL